MRYEINLIGNTQQKSQKDKKTAFIVNAISGTAVLVLFLSALGIFLLKNYYASNDLKQQEQDLISSLASFHTKIVKSDLVADRLSNISSLLGKRNQYEARMGEIIAVTPSDVTFSDFKIEKKNITVTVESASLASLDTFVNTLTSYVAQKKSFGDVTLVSLNADKSAKGYTASLSLSLL